MNKIDFENYLSKHYGDNNKTIAQIAKEVGRTEGTVRQTASKLGVKRGTNFPKIEGEEWRSLSFCNLSNYCVSSMGRIKNLNNKLLAAQPHHQSGYLQIRLVDDFGRKTTKLVHRLVFLAFVNECIDEGLQVDHIDGDRTNARLSNLELVSVSENIQRQSKKRKTPYFLTDKEVHSICEMLENGFSISEIMACNSNFTKAHVEKIKQKQRHIKISQYYNI